MNQRLPLLLALVNCWNEEFSALFLRQSFGDGNHDTRQAKSLHYSVLKLVPRLEVQSLIHKLKIFMIEAVNDYLL